MVRKAIGWLLLLCMVGTAYALTGQGNVSLNINDSNGTLWYPGGNASFDASQNFSGTYVFNVTVLPNPVNSSINMSIGESRTLTGYYDVLSLTCLNGTQPVSNGSVCTAKANLSAGESYTASNSVCDIKFTCSKTCEFSPNSTYNITKDVGIVKNGDLVTLTLGNTSQVVDLRVLNASTTVSLDFMCPLNPIDALTDQQAQIAYDMCSVYFPLVNDWLNLSLNRCFDNYDAYRDYVQTHDAYVQTANQELSDCRAREGQKDGELIIKNSQITTLEQELQKRDNRLDNVIILLCIVGFGLFMSMALNAVLWRQTGGQE